MSDVFQEHRALLFTVAYEMLGSVADAEDVVQDTWLRWSATDRGDVADPKAYLVRIATRLSLNRLRTLRNRRETYVGPWLPEPILTSPDAATDVERMEDVSMAMLVVLETLSPLERAVFVLHDVFGFSYSEVAAALDRSEAAVRQLAHRAREHVQARRPRFDTDPDRQREVTARFVEATLSGDVEALLEILAPDVVLITDSGGKVTAARRPVVTADNVARFLVGLNTKYGVPALRLEQAELNHAPGMIAWAGDDILMAGLAEVTDGRITRILMFRNPDRMSGLRPTT